MTRTIPMVSNVRIWRPCVDQSVTTKLRKLRTMAGNPSLNGNGFGASLAATLVIGAILSIEVNGLLILNIMSALSAMPQPNSWPPVAVGNSDRIAIAPARLEAFFALARVDQRIDQP